MHRSKVLISPDPRSRDAPRTGRVTTTACPSAPMARASPTFPTGGGEGVAKPRKWGVAGKRSHYKAGCSERVSWPLAVIRGGLRGQIEVELPYEELLAGVELGVAAEDEHAVVGGEIASNCAP